MYLISREVNNVSDVLAEVRAEQARRLSGMKQANGIVDESWKKDVLSQSEIDALTGNEDITEKVRRNNLTDQQVEELMASVDEGELGEIIEEPFVVGRVVTTDAESGETYTLDEKDLLPSEQADEEFGNDHCMRCGGTGHLRRSKDDRRVCVQCVSTWRSRMIALRNTNVDWMTTAKAANLELWERQPGETQWEYELWCAFRDMYPANRPTVAAVAHTLGVPRSVVGNLHSRWSWAVRLQSWIKKIDTETAAARRSEISAMNERHISLANKLLAKVEQGIDMLDMSLARPQDVVQLLKQMNELERTAHYDELRNYEKHAEQSAAADSPGLKTIESKQSDLGEIVGVLAQAGVLGDITRIGVKQHDTEVVAEVSKQSRDADETYIDANWEGED